MTKIVFIGAGSIIFVKNLIGDCLRTPSLQNAEFALLDIDKKKLKLAEEMLKQLNTNINEERAIIKAYDSQKEALRNADYVINAIQVGGYDPCVINDFEIPLKYGLKQTYADTLGIGGIFRGLRTIPVMLDILKDMEEVCPNALLLNYTNPMGIIMNAILKESSIQSVGLCHSVQVCAKELLEPLDMNHTNVKTKIAGINHQAWLLEISQNGEDLYPAIKRKSIEKLDEIDDRVRHEIMHRFGYYVTESSQHTAEYLPYFIKNTYPELIEKYKVKVKMYKDWGQSQIDFWNNTKQNLIENTELTHERTHEFASYIMEAVETNIPYRIHGNVLNNNFITNLPNDVCVEVPCLVDSNGIQPCYVGALPPQCAALNLTNINVQSLTVEAALTKKKEFIYYAALLDPHTSSELSIDDIISMTDEMLNANKRWIKLDN